MRNNIRVNNSGTTLTNQDVALYLFISLVLLVIGMSIHYKISDTKYQAGRRAGYSAGIEAGKTLGHTQTIQANEKSVNAAISQSWQDGCVVSMSSVIDGIEASGRVSPVDKQDLPTICYSSIPSMSYYNLREN